MKPDAAEIHPAWAGRLNALALRAPADLPLGRRGLRAPLAGISALMALAALISLRAVVEGGAAHGSVTIDYRLDGPSWTGPALAAAAAAFALAAGLLWAARRPATFAVGLALVPLALGGGAIALTERHGEGHISRAEARAVPIGAPRAEVTGTLGAPAGHATLGHRGDELDCLMYESEARDRFGTRVRYAFCFRGERLAVRDAW
jgi:hypothetical protein